MKHHQSHVGIPRVLLSTFEKGGHLYAYRMGHDGPPFPISAEKAGRERDYYDSEAESTLNHLESLVGMVLSYRGPNLSVHEFINYLQDHRGLLEDVVKFQMSRSKVTLEEVNKYSKIAQATGIPFTHSDLIKSQNEIKANPIHLIQGPLSIRLLVATGDYNFITNSLGLFLMMTPKRSGKFEYIIPVGPRMSIRLFHAEEGELENSHFECGNREVLLLNTHCRIFESVRGNGFLYAADEVSLELCLGRTVVGEKWEH